MAGSPYVILGLKEGAVEFDVKKAYRRLSRQHHPDLGGNPVAFDAISKAYEAIVSGAYVTPNTSTQGTRLVHESLFNVVNKER